MSEAPGSRSGSMFGPYHLKRPLGRGGMGEVYEAEHTVKGWTVAVKLMSEAVSKDPVFRERMKREARIAGRLQEPHVVPIHDYGEIDGQMYLEMRLIEGMDLDSILTRFGPLPPPRAIAVITQIAKALDAAHDADVMHRDVKPPNILVTHDDFAYLVDFGIASAKTEQKLTQLGEAVGTWKYMAPERFTNVEPTLRADVYSLACVLYECLTGSAPYASDNAAVLVSAHMMEAIPKPSVAREGVPKALDAVIARGMAKKPEERYESAGELARAAQKALSEPDRENVADIVRRSQEAELPAQLAEPRTVEVRRAGPSTPQPRPPGPPPQGPSGPIPRPPSPTPPGSSRPPSPTPPGQSRPPGPPPQGSSGAIPRPPQGPSGAIPRPPGPPPQGPSGAIPRPPGPSPQAPSGAIPRPPGPPPQGPSGAIPRPPGPVGQQPWGPSGGSMPPPGPPPSPSRGFAPAGSGGMPPAGPPFMAAPQPPNAPMPWGPGPQPPRGRSPWMIAAGVIAVVLVLVLVCLGIWAANKDDGSRTNGQATTTTTTRTTTRTTLPTTTTTLPPSSSVPSNAVAQLLSLLPAGYPAGACNQDAKTMPGAVVSVTCTQNTDVNGPRVSAYGLYADVASLKSNFTGFVGTFTLQSCPNNGASPGTWWHNRDPNTILGQVACGVYKGSDPQVMWTNEQTLVFALAGGKAGTPTLDQLYKWWASHS